MCRKAQLPPVSRAGGPITNIAKKKTIHTEEIISQNLLGLKSEERIEELLLSFRKRNLLAACIQETWRHGTNTLENEDCLIHLSGLPEDQMRSNRGEEGVGIVLSRKGIEAWKKAGSVLHNDFGGRIIAVRLLLQDEKGGDVGLFLVSAYAPVGKADDLKWEEFFELLSTCVARKTESDILLIGSDVNSSLGTMRRQGQSVMPSVGPFGLRHTNPSGYRLRTFLETNSFVAATTYFKKKSYATWTHPRSKKPHQIDHFLTEKGMLCRLTDAGRTLPILGSDHMAVMCKVKITARLKKRSQTNRQKLLKLDTSVLKDKETKSLFCKTVESKFSEGDIAGTTYSRLSKAMEDSAKEVIPIRPKAQPGWFVAHEEKLSKLVEERNEAMSLAIARKKRTRAHTLRLRKARKNLKSAVTEAKNEWIKERCDILNQAGTLKGTSQCWKAVTELKKGLAKTRPSAETMMKKADGSTCKSAIENGEVFKAHFEELFDRSPVYDEEALSAIDQHPILTEFDTIPDDKEIHDAVLKMKDKAPGDSGLKPQLWKALLSEEATFQILKIMVLDFWESELPPQEWLNGLLKILAKKGDLSLPGNYRGIMLLECAYKIISILLLNRLQPIAEKLDHEQQCGFRPGRGCTDAVYTVKWP